jgi:hypothetical protein
MNSLITKQIASIGEVQRGEAQGLLFDERHDEHADHECGMRLSITRLAEARSSKITCQVVPAEPVD